MKTLSVVIGLIASAALASAAEEFFDRVEEALTFSMADTRVRARVSGLLDLEGYDTQLPAPGLIHTTGEQLFNPRLTVFLDAQFGRHFYFFAQARSDRGFDPATRHADARLDEYALRWTPGRRAGFNLQVGKFATVVGNWTARHPSWINPFITAPLPYENLTGIWDKEVVRSSSVLLQWAHVRPGLPPEIAAREKSFRIPMVWGPSYVPGVAVSGGLGDVRYAAELKFGALSSRPEAWQHAREQRHHPAFGVRLGYRPNPAWDLGVSASSGTYLREFAEYTIPAGHARGDFRQLVIAHDVAFAWHHLQLWGEVYAARFEIPRVGDAETLAYYTEAKYKFTPQLSGAVRWNQQLFGTIPDRRGPTRWGNEVWRVDFAPAYRFTSHTQLKLQYSLQHGDSRDRDYTRLLAAQFTLRF